MSCTLRIVFVSKEELASLCSPIPVWGSLARNKNAVAFSLFCFLSALRSELASLRSPIPFRDSFARNKNALAFSLFCFLPASSASSQSDIKQNKRTFQFSCFLRRGRDSNPRYLSVRRFSRPVQSTTLPPLQRFFCVSRCGRFVLTLQKYIKDLNRARVCKKNFKYFFKFVLFGLFSCLFPVFSTDFGL